MAIRSFYVLYLMNYNLYNQTFISCNLHIYFRIVYWFVTQLSLPYSVL